MSVRRVLLFLMGLLVAGALMMFVLPFLGIPSSHFLPPSRVYAGAQGEAKGAIVSKYYDETGNPFHVGDHLYFLNYKFRAHTPPVRGTAEPGPVQVYSGTLRVDKDTYDTLPVQDADKNTAFVAKQIIQLDPYPVRVKYEKSYPEINGIEDTWANGDRSIGAGSNVLSGWIIWLVVAVFLGWLMMMIFERFGQQENI
jgi:hypothetical protein